MSQVALAEELDVSRTPLREARGCSSEGLVDAQANRRVTVRPISATDLEELVVMRVVLESEAVRLSVERLTPEGIAALEGRLAEMAHFAQDNDYARWQTAARRLPPRADGAGGRACERDAGPALRPCRALPAAAHRPRCAGLLTEGHREILDAAKTADRDGVAHLLADHFSRTAFDVMELLEPGYVAARLRQTLEDVGAAKVKRRRARRAA